ncbi:MAG: phosphate ABC transporter permease PstA [Chloroflexi bacterium]|nr:phosphate ABC transporter permease PstA [Chloroflexota bacterium]
MKLSAKTTQRLAWGVMWAIAMFVVAALVLIIGYVFFHGIPTLSWDFVFGPTTYGDGGGGLRTPIIGSIYLLLLTLVFVVPFGIGAAIYLAEYTPRGRFSRVVRYGVDTLAGVPSIIFGMFGFAFFVMILLAGRMCLLAAALSLACLNLPFMVGAAEEAIRAVPQSQREAALALGATKWQTVWHVVLPSAMPGIITGVILCAGTAMAETAPLLFTLKLVPFIPTSPLDNSQTLTLRLLDLALYRESVGGVTRQDLIAQAMGVGVILILIVIALNFLARWLSRRYITKMTGGG